jgi:hypothetical protein
MHRIIIALVFCLFAVSAGLADDKWPQRPLYWVIPFGAGGGADFAAMLCRVGLCAEKPWARSQPGNGWRGPARTGASLLQAFYKGEDMWLQSGVPAQGGLV